MARLPANARYEGGAHEVDQVVRQLAGNDLAAQAMLLRPFLTDQFQSLRGEVLVEVVGGGRIIRELGRVEFGLQVELGVGEQDGQLGPGEGLVRITSVQELLPRR